MTGFLKKRLESLYYENKGWISDIIEEHCNRSFTKATVTSNHKSFNINIKDINKTSYQIEHKLRQILGVPVTFSHKTHWTVRLNPNDIKHPKYHEKGSYNYKLYYKDL